MRICAVNSSLFARIFKSLGHDVLSVNPDPGPFPDLLLEVELLRPRTILFGLGELPCTKVYWSVDTHLNAWWHRVYGRLFDLVLSTQDSWLPTLRTLGLENVAHLPWFGRQRPLRAWEERAHPLAFVGRVTAERPVRKRMTEHLAHEHGLTLVQDADYAQMLDLYDNTWLVPNESIFSEVNFRLFEGASCGCVVLNQTVSSDIGRLFEPGREVEVYDTIVDLDMLIRRHLENPAKARQMGRAAWARVQAEHLPEHRAARILELAESASGALRGEDARVLVWDCLFRLNEAGMYVSDVDRIATHLAARGRMPDGMATLLRCLFWLGRREEALGLAAGLVANKCFPGNLELNLTASGLALKCGQWELAKAVWLRYVRARNLRRQDVPESPLDLWNLWATQCERDWVTVRSGLRYDTTRGLPEAAMDCLMEANELSPGNLEAVQRMNTILSRQGSGGGGFRLNLLSHLGLHRPGDWRLGLELATVNLQTMRLKEGMEELILAFDAATDKGEQKRFLSVLAARDPYGALAKRLGVPSQSPA